MRKTKLLKILLIPILGTSAIGITAVSTSCNCKEAIRVTSVELDKSEISLEVGGSDKLTATIKPVDATDKSVTWSSDDESIATIDANGNVTGVSKGTATITVTTKDGGYEATCHVTVTNTVIHVTGVSLDKKSVSLNEGATETLKANVLPENATDKSVTWSSSNEEIATVDTNGNVIGVSKGTATITVTTKDGGFTDTCEVTVNEKVIHVTGVTLNKKSTALNVGDTETLTATISPEDATDKSVTWSSSNEEIATVDTNGNVIGVSKGTATITVTTKDGGFTDTCEVNVKEYIHVTSVKLTNHTYVLQIGKTVTLTANVSPEDATDKTVSWFSSKKIVIVDANGKVSAVATGEADVTVKTNDGEYEDTCKIVILPKVVGIDCVNLTSFAPDPEQSSFKLENHGNNHPNLLYSYDKINWFEYEDEQVLTFGFEKTLYLRGNNPTGWSKDDTNFSNFLITGDVTVSGNIMNLLDNGTENGEEGHITDIPCNYCFYDLFNACSGVKSFSKNFLPATVLKDYCYNDIFNQCTSLVEIPKLPAENLVPYCYKGMFRNCTALEEAAELPKLSPTTLAESCYEAMFQGCTSLKKAPELPATTLARSCCNSMFFDCESLITAPAKLPATELEEYCYYQMFNGCTSLTRAPELPATKLAYCCYSEMFSNCTSLQAAPELPAMTLETYCYRGMFKGCYFSSPLSELPATKLAAGCYQYMFSNCYQLNIPPRLPAMELAVACYEYMFQNCRQLETAPDLPGTTLDKRCYQYMFADCINLNSIKIGYTGLVINAPSSAFASWVDGVAKTGTLFYNGTDKNLNFGLPIEWKIQPYN